MIINKFNARGSGYVLDWNAHLPLPKSVK